MQRLEVGSACIQLFCKLLASNPRYFSSVFVNKRFSKRSTFVDQCSRWEIYIGWPTTLFDSQLICMIFGCRQK